MGKKYFSVALAFLTLSVFAACTQSGSSGGDASAPTVSEERHSFSDTSSTDPVNPANSPAQDGAALPVQVLLFNGVGTSVSDWQSLERILTSAGLTYRLVNSSTLNAMTLTEMKTFKLILIPGGNSNTINTALPVSTRIRVRQAVRDGGVSFLGICAGAFDAVGIDSLSNTTAYYGFAVAQGNYLTTWYPNGNRNILATVPQISFADGSRRYLMWYDGPFTPEWKGGVVARYPDGKPAISQTWTGNGFVIVSGPHPEAPPNWQYDSGPDPDGLDYDIALKLIQSAMNRKPLPVY